MHTLKLQWLKEMLSYLCDVTVEFLQRGFAVDEGIPCALPQLH